MGALRPRKHDRRSHLHEVRYRLASGGILLRGNTIDLSPSGVRLFCPQAPPLGDTIELTWADSEPPVTVSGRIVYVRVEVEGSSAGVTFYQPLAPAVFQAVCLPGRSLSRR